ncbi:hypothetical protein Aph01nite_32480 [Acrocarpospora phusangensis]|uniref:Polyprenol-phosphate-mannose-dependent alpha-(1-2)-phosphatidylinositol mannoside mannosyltransferase n=1 Tax=Acrocarpospora phusangensis TaxID=1070424 RepID=A0A919QAA0_9ACTN|nr:glycosyltransferase 87 family protein [Acrocarpospora phusangensis]GIH24938.1 hypothetical protein Aph01nite_32480 [Acrocarpospora phusangensis]
MSTGEPVALSGRRPWWGWALTLLIILVAAWPLVGYWLGNPDDQRLVDLDVYRTGGWALLQGLPVYDVITPAPQLLPFTYPPIAAMMAVPLALISWETAQWTWTAAIILTLTATVWYAFRDYLTRLPGRSLHILGGVRTTGRTLLGSAVAERTSPPRRSGDTRATVSSEGTSKDAEATGGLPSGSGGKARALLFARVFGAARAAKPLPAVAVPIMFGVVTVACLYLMPIRDQIRFGQVDLFLVALCLLDCVVRRPWWPRGLLIGIATAVKLTPGVFLIYLAVTAWRDPAQRKPLYTATGTAAALTLLPFAVIPADAADFWFSALLDSERLGANTATTNQSIRGMLLRLYWPDALTTALWLAAVALIGWYGFRAAYRAHRDGDTLTAVALTGLMAVLLSPVAWIHHLAWIVVVIAALAVRRPLLAAGVWVYYVLPIPWWGAYIKLWEIPVLSPTLGKIVQNAFGLGAIALVWVLARRPGSAVAGKPAAEDSASGDSVPRNSTPGRSATGDSISGTSAPEDSAPGTSATAASGSEDSGSGDLAKS